MEGKRLITDETGQGIIRAIAQLNRPSTGGGDGGGGSGNEVWELIASMQVDESTVAPYVFTEDLSGGEFAVKKAVILITGPKFLTNAYIGFTFSGDGAFKNFGYFGSASGTDNITIIEINTVPLLEINTSSRVANANSPCTKNVLASWGNNIVNVGSITGIRFGYNATAIFAAGTKIDIYGVRA